jgi:nucleotide-binding universal stress UspA family protein
MLPIRTILHPTDFSDRSGYALHLACALARDHGARVDILHVTPRPFLAYGEGVIPPDPEFVSQEARQRLDTRRRIEEGDEAEVILRVARETPADLIVMGTHGRTGLGRLLMGSVAEQVVRRASCPVLTVSTPFPPTPDAPVAEPAGAAGV